MRIFDWIKMQATLGTKKVLMEKDTDQSLRVFTGRRNLFLSAASSLFLRDALGPVLNGNNSTTERLTSEDAYN